jgi:hypothetical protein
MLRRTLDNAGDAVSSAFPKGKQHGSFSLFVDVTPGEFAKLARERSNLRLSLLLGTFCHVVYATLGLISIGKGPSSVSMSFPERINLTVMRLSEDSS